MTLIVVDHLLYGVAWASFGLGHSWLAGDSVKAKLKGSLGPRYRLTYNVVAVFHIIAITQMGKILLPTAPLGLPNGLWVISILGGFLMLVAMGPYDLGLLGGIKQIKRAKLGLPLEDEQPFTAKGPLLLVRHPIYSAAFLIFWGLASSEYGLATAIWGSAYLTIGAWFEERRLVTRFGHAYLDYKKQVPAFIPWKGRVRLQSNQN